MIACNNTLNIHKPHPYICMNCEQCIRKIAIVLTMVFGMAIPTYVHLHTFLYLFHWFFIVQYVCIHIAKSLFCVNFHTLNM